MTNKQFQTNHARSSGKRSQQQLCKYKFGSDKIVVSVYRSLSRQTQFTIENFHSDGIFYSTAFPMWLISDLIPIGFFDVYRTLVHTYHRQTLAKNSWTKHLNMLFVSEFISVWCQRSIASSTLTFEMFRARVHSIRICACRLSQRLFSDHLLKMEIQLDMCFICSATHLSMIHLRRCWSWYDGYC